MIWLKHMYLIQGKQIEMRFQVFSRTCSSTYSPAFRIVVMANLRWGATVVLDVAYRTCTIEKGPDVHVVLPVHTFDRGHFLFPVLAASLDVVDVDRDTSLLTVGFVQDGSSNNGMSRESLYSYDIC